MHRTHKIWGFKHVDKKKKKKHMDLKKEKQKYLIQKTIQKKKKKTRQIKKIQYIIYG